MKRAALYVRVSSQGQVRDGYSLQFQEQILREFCAREELLVADVYCDGGQSGSTANRRELLRLITDARQRRFDLVLIFRVDRFSRDPVDLLALVRELAAQQIKLRSVTESVDAGDPAGELMLTILGAIGKFVRQNIIQNAMLGKTKRAESGRYTGGRVPFGYLVDETGIYQPDRQIWWNGYSAAEVVGLLYKTYLEEAQQGGGCLAVARRFNQLGIPGPRLTWGHATVHQMLSNPCYIGDLSYNKRSHPLGRRAQSRLRAEWIVAPGAHEPLVEREVWEQVQVQMQRNRTGGGRPRDGAFRDLITGFACCGECGSALTPRRPSGTQRYLYYTCASRYSEQRRREGSACEHFPWFRGDELSRLIWQAVLAVAADEQVMWAVWERIRGGDGRKREATSAEVARLERQVAGLEEQAMRLATAFAQGQLTDSLWQRQMARLEAERSGLANRLSQAEEGLVSFSPGICLPAGHIGLQAPLEALLTADLPLHLRREALAILAGPRAIRIFADGRVEIALRVAVANPSVPPRLAP